jgi:RimJ/RimL family protein N-acetyltransferase
MPGITTRPLTPAEAPLFAALRREALLDTPHAFSNTPEEDRPVDDTARALAGPGYAIIGAFDHTSLVGIAGLIREPRLKLAHIATIWGVYVTPTHRSRGIARALIAHALDTARSWPNLARVRLSVSSGCPAAQHVYEAAGFRIWGREPDGLRHNATSYDEIYLSFPLENR